MYYGFYLIKEWDGSHNTVWVRKVKDAPWGTYTMLYKSGTRHEVKYYYLKSVVIRPSFSSEINHSLF